MRMGLLKATADYPRGIAQFWQIGAPIASVQAEAPGEPNCEIDL